MDNADVGNASWEPQAELRNSLARKKEKLCVSRGKQTLSGG